MSLATSGGGGGGLGGGGGAGGLMMAHDAHAGQVGMAQPPPPPTTTASSATGTASSSSSSTPSWAAIEAYDKTQRLSLAKAKSTAHLPLCAVDLHASMPTVAYFPPKLAATTTTTTTTTTETKPNQKKATPRPNKLHPIFLGKMKGKVSFQATEAAHKALRKYLTATTTTELPSYTALKRDCLATTTTKDEDKDKEESCVVTLDRPYLCLGLRRVEQLPPIVQTKWPIRSNDNDNDNKPCCWWTNSTLDGASEPSDDFDMDRAVVKVRLHPATTTTTTTTTKKKKPLTILPEEATQLLLHQARSHVAQATKFAIRSHSGTAADGDDNGTNTTEPILEEWKLFPLALALPSWAMHDAAAEALYEASSSTGPAGDANGGVFVDDNDSSAAAVPPTLLFPRSTCAVLGALLKPDPYNNPQQQQQQQQQQQPPSNPTATNQFVRRLKTVQQMLWKQHQVQHGRHAKEAPFAATTLIVAMGTTPEGCEVTALQLSYPPTGGEEQYYDNGDDDNDENNNNNNNNNVVAKYCLFEEYQVLANVSKFLPATAASTTSTSSRSKTTTNGQQQDNDNGEEDEEEDEQEDDQDHPPSNQANNIIITKPWQLLDSCLSELQLLLETVAPDSDGPAAVLSYGSTAEQEALHQAVRQLLASSAYSSNQNDEHWLAKVPVIQASPEAVPTGAALLGGVALGRVGSSGGGRKGGGGRGSGGGKNLPLRVQSVATVATGVARYYTAQQRQDHAQQIWHNMQRQQQQQQQQQGDNDNHDDNNNSNNHHHPTNPFDDKQIKVVFDFDRRLPAGPYAMEFKASECVVHQQRMIKQEEEFRKNKNNNKDAVFAYNQEVEEQDESFWKAVKDAESSKHISKREQAALDFTVQIFQKYTRDGPWHLVGNPMAPLVKLDTQVHDSATNDGELEDDAEETKIACEQVTLELSMAVTGVLTTGWAGERESVVQAVKSARGRLYEYYGWLAFAILFFGGFFVKSYWEDYVWKRDTSRLLEYYKTVSPGSPQDGDADTARWLAYKYRHNKDKLWNNLETKYGVPVPKDWPSSSFQSSFDENNYKNHKKYNDEDNNEEVDLDDKDEEPEEKDANEKTTQVNEEEDEEAAAAQPTAATTDEDKEETEAESTASPDAAGQDKNVDEPDL
ncbi:hypothetical protein ACA910_011842 [Epithemia clementina (nom. ined.)]